MANILFVDDEAISQTLYKGFLEKHGHKVEIAKNEDEARKMLRSQRFNLAIIDVKLTDAIGDTTGLILAREEAHFLPKIILTNYPSLETAEIALQVFPDGIPPAINLIQKGSDYYPELLEAVETALSLAKVWQGMSSYNSALQLDYETAQKQASAMYVAALVFSILGAIIILAGIVAIILMITAAGLTRDWLLALGSLIGTLAGVVTEVIGLLFFRRVDVANQRMDRYHNERSAGLRFEILFNASDQLSDVSQISEMKKRVILQATSGWLGQKEPSATPAAKDQAL